MPLAICALLRSVGIEVMSTVTRTEAVQVNSDEQDSVDLLVTDVDLPGMPIDITSPTNEYEDGMMTEIVF